MDKKYTLFTAGWGISCNTTEGKHTHVSKEGCLEAALSLGSDHNLVLQKEVNPYELFETYVWENAPCGCCIWKDRNIMYRNPYVGSQCSSTEYAQLVCEEEQKEGYRGGGVEGDVLYDRENIDWISFKLLRLRSNRTLCLGIEKEEKRNMDQFEQGPAIILKRCDLYSQWDQYWHYDLQGTLEVRTHTGNLNLGLYHSEYKRYHTTVTAFQSDDRWYFNSDGSIQLKTSNNETDVFLSPTGCEIRENVTFELKSKRNNCGQEWMVSTLFVISKNIIYLYCIHVILMYIFYCIIHLSS
jgi:hypothetical protein